MIRDDGPPQAEGASGEGESEKSTEGKSASEKPGDAAARATSFWRRPRTRTALLCVGFLVIGFGLGSIVTSAAIHRMVRHGLRDPGRLAAKVLSHMRRELDLTDEQAAGILPILEKRFAGVRDAIRREHDAIGREIEPLLSPEQRATHKQIIEERRARFLGNGCPKEGPE